MKPCVVIPVYIATKELKQLTVDTIQSMKETADVFVVTVNDGSPNSTKFLYEVADHVINMGENSGFAKSCNAGFDWAVQEGYDYIICANNDIEVYEGWLEALMYPFDTYEHVGLTGLISSKDKCVYGTMIEHYKINKITDGGLLHGPMNTWMMSGGLWMSRSRILTEIGFFDTQFEIGGEEDVDLFLRASRDYGYKIVMSGQSCFWHKEGATRWNDEVEPGFKHKNKQIENQNYDRFIAKWGWDPREDIGFYEEILEII